MIAIDQLSSDELLPRMRRRLSSKRPGKAAQRLMAPSLAYGRHHGPLALGTREAAVLVALVPSPTGWRVPLVTRPGSMRTHAGQVSFPGGMIEAGESWDEAAIREFAEEVGPELSHDAIAGSLSSVFVFVSGFVIRPIVAIAPSPLEFQPSAAEVAKLLLLPPELLVEPTCRGIHRIERRGLGFTAPCYQFDEQQIWGATSMILAELAAVLEELSPVDRS